ncbi:hypothetical protein NUACC21_37440 [Scytonema sp. NUACC21]
MERLRILDLSFCENEVSDLGQVQGGNLVVGLAVGFDAANRTAFTSNFSFERTGLTSADIIVSGGASASGATGGAASGAAAAGGFVSVFSSASATAS